MKLCLTCRARLDDDEACDSEHEVVALDDAGWARVCAAVWGDGADAPGRRAAFAFAAQISLLLLAVLGAAALVATTWISGAAIWLGAGGLWLVATALLTRRILDERGVRVRRHASAARGVPPPLPQRGAALRGVVVATERVVSPLGDSAAAWGLSLERAGAVLVRDARTAPLAIRLGEGTLVEVPAGRITLFGPRTPVRHPDLPRRVRRWLRPPRGPDPFPFDSAAQTLVTDGDIVDLVADIDPSGPNLRALPPIELHLRPPAP